jgi:hypothetical protein
MEWHALNKPDSSSQLPPKGEYVLLYIPNNLWEHEWPYYFGYWKDSGLGGVVWTVYPQKPMDGQGHLVTHWSELSSPTGQHFSQ